MLKKGLLFDCDHYWLALFSFLLLSTYSQQAFAQQTKPMQGKPPSWISVEKIDYSKTKLDKDASDGYIDVWVEKQVSLATQTRYVRFCKKILSETGVQNVSTINISFDPSYEVLTLHSIEIIRDGQRINKLSLSNIKTLHQEEDLKNFIYNGSLDAVLILEDVRKGDFLEYSYSIKGTNPVFKNKYADEYETQFSVPVYSIYHRLMVPENRTVTIKNFNEPLQPNVIKKDNQSIYEWRKTDVAPLLAQDHTPSWYDPFGRISISEFKSWKEVNSWAMELFPHQQKLPSTLQTKIREISSADSLPAKRLAAALRFVQDDIRYMGIEMGQHSHRPADPARVLAQRFGDCKEKSYLLCCMLSAMQIDAQPILISTNSKKSLFDFLPSPLHFNHTTVRVKIDNSYYFYDPTIAFQRGDIKDIFYPDYQAGLVVDDSTQALTTIPFRKISYQHIDEYFKVENMNGVGSLVVTTKFKGDEADGTRRLYHNQSNTEILTGDKKFYTKYYSDIVADSLTFTDDEQTGVFTTKEYYTIPSFWTMEGKRKKFSFSAFAIDNLMTVSKDKNRTMPLELMYPATYQEEVTVVLPEEWNVEESETHLKNKGFNFDSKFFNEYNQVHMVASYENHKDFVSAEESSDYFNNVDKYNNNENFFLSYGEEDNKDKKTKSHDSSSNTIVIIVVLLVGIILTIFLKRRG